MAEGTTINVELEPDDDVTLNEDGSIVEAPATPEQQPVTPAAGEDDEDAPAVNQTPDDSDLHAGDGRSDEEREAIRQRRREERARKKQARAEREASHRRELASRDRVIDELNTRLGVLEKKSTGTELAQIDNAIMQANNAVKHFQGVIADAAAQNNGQVLADATAKMVAASRQADELGRVRNAFVAQQNQPVQPTQPQVDPRLMEYANSWLAKNSWYSPAGTDLDSRITLQIDQDLAAQGWDPKTPEYWEELSQRVGRYLPHRATGGRIQPSSPSGKPQPRSVVAGSGRESTTSSTSVQTYKLSAERVRALKDAGMWDDPKARADAIKRFREYDVANARQ